MTAKIYIPALAAIVLMLGVIMGLMVHRHDRRVYQREHYRQEENQALAADCISLWKDGEKTMVCKSFFAKHPGLKP